VVRVVILDVDGTLMDTNYLHTEAWARALDEVDHRAPRAEVHKQIGKGSDQLIREFVDEEDAAEKVDERHGELYGELQYYGYPLPGAKELIASLAERGYEVWFVTSAKPEELEMHQECLESEGKISGVVNSSEVERSKPAPDIFGLALERLGVGPERAVVFGDTVWDVRAAAALGVPAVAVCTGGIGEPMLREAGAVAVYESPAALVEASEHPWLDAVLGGGAAR
jgi:HAD superfamily hydrolase (TIGR01509 family)